VSLRTDSKMVRKRTLRLYKLCRLQRICDAQKRQLDRQLDTRNPKPDTDA